MVSFNSTAFHLLAFCFIFKLDIVCGWDSDELELFDLVEEINENFYTLLRVDETASIGDIRSAYRNLSRYLHPDKNKEPDAEVKFRQLAAVYEVLKDASKRAKYDEVLANGLPNWRQPVFYYRRVKKMGLVEMTILLTIILTVCHFLVVWSIYFEQKFEKERQFSSRKKQDKKKGKQTVDLDKKAEAEKIEKPRLTNLLPCLLFRLAVYAVKSIPSLVRLMVEKLKDAVNPPKIEEISEEEDADDKERLPRPKKPKTNFMETLPSAYESSIAGSQSRESEKSENDTNLSSRMTQESNSWTDAEVDLLRKAVIKFPGATTDRWEKIAQMVGKSVKEVTSKSKELKQTPTCTVDPSQQGITLSRLLNGSTAKFTLPDDLSKREIYAEEGSAVRRRTHPPAKTADRTLMIATAQPQQSTQDSNTPEVTGQASVTTGQPVVKEQQWTQAQQRLLESALTQFPKGSADRWDRVAELVPGKTKEDCIRRCKYLSEVVKQKHSSDQPSSTTS